MLFEYFKALKHSIFYYKYKEYLLSLSLGCELPKGRDFSLFICIPFEYFSYPLRRINYYLYAVVLYFFKKKCWQKENYNSANEISHFNYQPLALFGKELNPRSTSSRKQCQIIKQFYSIKIHKASTMCKRHYASCVENTKIQSYSLIRI